MFFLGGNANRPKKTFARFRLSPLGRLQPTVNALYTSKDDGAAIEDVAVYGEKPNIPVGKFVPREYGAAHPWSIILCNAHESI